MGLAQFDANPIFPDNIPAQESSKGAELDRIRKDLSDLELERRCMRLKKLNDEWYRAHQKKKEIQASLQTYEARLYEIEDEEAIQKKADSAEQEVLDQARPRTYPEMPLIINP